MKKDIFITATDTNIGKTIISSLLCQSLLEHNYKKVNYCKPIQTGADDDTTTVLNITDLKQQKNISPIYYYNLPISPNRASSIENRPIDFKVLKKYFDNMQGISIWEGAGGIEVPLTKSKTTIDLIKMFNIPIIVVSSTKLGTINHTILTVKNAFINNIKVAGIILVGDKDHGLKECLEQYLPIKVICEIPKFNEINKEVIKTYAREFFPKDLIENLIHKKDKKINTKNLLWHPFTQHKKLTDIPNIKQGRDEFLTLDNGLEIIDSISSWWVNLHGHCNKKISQAIYKQANTLEHAIFAGFSHDPAIELSEKLLSKTNGFSKVFFSDNGSTAVEVSLKIAYQYNKNNRDDRPLFLALKNSYHGDTIGAMAVSDSNGYHKTFKPLMPKVDFVETDNYESLKSFDRNAEKYSAFIVEPLIQGAGGMKIYSTEFLKAIREFCNKHNIIMICDEIFTGFYRTGKMFAFEHTNITPDIICLSKGITGGFMPLSVTLTTEKIFHKFLSDNVEDAFLHGHSYTANPLACSAALESWDILNSKQCQDNIKRISSITKERIERLDKKINIRNPRYMGTIGAFDVTGVGNYFSGNFSNEFAKKALDKGVLIRPLGNVVYTVPPYCISSESLNKIYDTIEEILC